jgi:hypothetical protein
MGADWWSNRAPDVGDIANQCQSLNIRAAEIRAEVDKLMAGTESRA